MTKEEIRSKYKEKRKDLKSVERFRFSKGIFEIVNKNYPLNGKKVSIFLPIERLFEVNTWPFLKKIKADFYLPVMTEGGGLIHVKFEDEKQLKKNDWGILEPTYGDQTKPFLFDYVIVPLLAFDESGYRVGYGKGFYDRFLSNCKSTCKFIGVSYFDEIEKIDDLNEADIPLHFCATPGKIIEFAKQS